MVTVTDDRHARYWLADAVEVIEPSVDRVEPPCRIARPGLCGGCDFQHVTPAAQRELKRQVVAEQLQRLAGISWDGVVESVESGTGREGLGWRTRMRYPVDADGRIGMRAHHSREVIPLPPEGCLIAHPELPAVVDRSWPAESEVVAVRSSTGDSLIVERPAGRIHEQVGDRSYTLDADGFWQVHPAAAATLVGAVIDGLRPEPGERAFDLYCGVGLFAGALVDAGCQVWGVEAGRTAINHARQNIGDAGGRARFTAGRVEKVLRTMPSRTDLIVLDPPRSGAGRSVMTETIARRPRAIAYVACDPAALARDLATAAKAGYRTAEVRAFDLFPMTHHVECVAVLVR